jgi:hypothetical protein
VVPSTQTFEAEPAGKISTKRGDTEYVEYICAHTHTYIHVGYDNGVRYWGGVCANICRKLTTVSFEGRLCDNYIHMMDLFSRFTNMGLLQIQLKRDIHRLTTFH